MRNREIAKRTTVILGDTPATLSGSAANFLQSATPTPSKTSSSDRLRSPALCGDHRMRRSLPADHPRQVSSFGDVFRDLARTPSSRIAAMVVGVRRDSSTPSPDIIASTNSVFFRTAPSAST